MAAISGEIVTEDQDPSLEEDGRPFESFQFGEREVHFAQPTPGQLLIVLGMLDVAEEENLQLQLEAVNNFGVVIGSLFTRSGDRRFVMRSLAKGAIDLPEYFDLAMEMLRRWAPEEIENRETRRKMDTKTPVAKRATRARR
jgi:hypothetical protein